MSTDLWLKQNIIEHFVSLGSIRNLDIPHAGPQWRKEFHKHSAKQKISRLKKYANLWIETIKQHFNYGIQSRVWAEKTIRWKMKCINQFIQVALCHCHCQLNYLCNSKQHPGIRKGKRLWMVHLKGNPILDSSKIVSKMNWARGLNPRHYSFPVKKTNINNDTDCYLIHTKNLKKKNPMITITLRRWEWESLWK